MARTTPSRVVSLYETRVRCLPRRIRTGNPVQSIRHDQVCGGSRSHLLASLQTAAGMLPRGVSVAEILRKPRFARLCRPRAVSATFRQCEMAAVDRNLHFNMLLHMAWATMLVIRMAIAHRACYVVCLAGCEWCWFAILGALYGSCAEESSALLRTHTWATT